MFLATWMYFSSTAIGFLFVADASFHMICFDDQALKPNWVIHSFWAPVTVLQSHCVTMPVPVEIENMLKVASCEKLCLSCWLFEILPYLSRFGLKSECTRTFELIVHSFFPNPCFSWWADGRVCFFNLAGQIMLTFLQFTRTANATRNRSRRWIVGLVNVFFWVPQRTRSLTLSQNFLQSQTICNSRGSVN